VLSRRGTLFGLLCLAAVLGACGSLNPSGSSVLGQETTASATCDTAATPAARAYSPSAQLVAAFDVTAAQVVAWQEKDAGPSAPRPISQWRSHDPAERVTVCYYDGTFDSFPRKGPPPPPPGVSPALSPRPFERIVLLVGQDGTAQLYVAGFRNTLPVTDPSRP